MINEIINKLRNKNIAILGFGREGRSTYNFIRKYLGDIKLTIIDLNKVDIDDTNVVVVCGDGYLNNLEKYDLVIKTPGISLKDIDTTNINITSQLELLLEVNKDNVIGITGTKGKSTTTALTYNILKENGLDVILAGNIGIPILDTIEDANSNTIFVVEMSSHQLEYIKYSPHIGVVLNLFEDHLDHAGSVKHYHEIKMNMFKYQNEFDVMIYCEDNDALLKLVNDNTYYSKKVSISLKNNEIIINGKNILFDKDIKRNILGDHNLENIMVAYSISKVLDLDEEKTLKAISEFKSLPYRLENIGTVNNVTYYVDTLATIPDATMEAIEALKNVNTLIFGGMDRGISYDGFSEFLNKSNIKHFICMPTTGHVIGKMLDQNKTYFVNTLEEACNIAKKVTDENTICLLSPAASSYEQFKNYQEKGDKYKEYILKGN